MVYVVCLYNNSVCMFVQEWCVLCLYKNKMWFCMLVQEWCFVCTRMVGVFVIHMQECCVHSLSLSPHPPGTLPCMSDDQCRRV